MKRLTTGLAMAAIMATAATGGGLSNPIIPADPVPQVQNAPTGLYVLGGIGGADFGSNYSSSNVYLDEPWKKKGMNSVLVDPNSDISGNNGTATVELGYVTNIGNSNFIVGAALDYTALNFSGDAICQEDAGLADNPYWPRPDHTCHATLDGAVSGTLIAGYQASERLDVRLGLGLARGYGSQGWEGKIERQPVAQVSDEDFTVDGVTYSLQAHYALNDSWSIGAEAQAFDFDAVDTQHEYGDTQTDFDVANVAVFVVLNF